MKYKKLPGSVVFRRRPLSHRCLRMRRRALIQQWAMGCVINRQRQMQKYWIMKRKKRSHCDVITSFFSLCSLFFFFGCSRSDGDLIQVFGQWSTQSDHLQNNLESSALSTSARMYDEVWGGDSHSSWNNSGFQQLPLITLLRFLSWASDCCPASTAAAMKHHLSSRAWPFLLATLATIAVKWITLVQLAKINLRAGRGYTDRCRWMLFVPIGRF